MNRLLLGLLLGLSTLMARGQDWAQAFQQSVDFYNDYQSEEARKAAEQALRLLQESQPTAIENKAAILRQLSIICYDLTDDEAALSYAQDEVESLLSLGKKTVNLAMALQNLAVIRMARSEYGAAEPLLEEALLIARAYQTDDSYELATMKGNLAIAKFQLAKDQEAMDLFESSVSTMRTYEELDGDYLNIIYNYGSLLSEKGSFDEALSFFEELETYYSYDKPNFEYGSILIKVGDALDELDRFGQAVKKYELAKQNFEALGETSTEEYSIALNNLIIDLQKTGQYARALQLSTDLLEIEKSKENSQPKNLSHALVAHANLLIRSGETTQAKKLLIEADSIYGAHELQKEKTYVLAKESLGSIYLKEGALKKALALAEQAIEIAHSEQLTTLNYSLQNLKARILLRQAKYDEAAKTAQLALTNCLERFGPDALKTAYVHNTLASVYTQQGNYPKADESFQKIIPIFKTTFGEQHPEYATVLTNYSSLLQLQGNYYSAEHYLLTAEQIKREAFGPKNPDYLTTQENLALLYLHTARYTEAMSLLEQIKQTKEEVLATNDPSLAYTLANLGTVKKQLADYSEAEKLLKKARAIYEESLGPDHIAQANVSNSLALLYQKMGNLDAARPLFGTALSIYEQTIGKFSPDYATALENLATLHQLEEDYTTARELLEEALQIDKAILGTHHPLYSKTLHNLASIYEEEAQYEQSRELYQQALDIDREVFGEQHPSYASTLYNLATLEQELENYDPALTYYQKVVEIRKNALGSNHPDYAFALYGLASILHKTGQFEEAQPMYAQVTNQYLEFIQKYFPSLSETEKSAFYSKIKPVFESYIEFAVEYCLLQKGSPEEQQALVGQIYDLQLVTKALLLNATNKVRNTILSSNDPELVGLFNEWLSLKESIVKAYSMSKEELNESDFSIQDLETKANETEKELSLKSTAFSSTFEQEQPTWKKVAASLNADQMAIEIIRVKKKTKADSILYVGLLLSNDTSSAPQLIVKADGPLMEGKGFKSYKNSIVYKVQDLKSYAVFWKPFDAAIPDKIKTIYLSADGVLNKVNLATLLNPETKSYILDRYKVRLLSNTRELIETADSDDLDNRMILFGYPQYQLDEATEGTSSLLLAGSNTERSFGEEISLLPGTLEEVKSIQTMAHAATWQNELYLEKEANEANIKQIKSPKVLHIATHGFFLEDLPEVDQEGGLTSRNARFNPLLRSGLLLAGAQNTLKNEDIPGEEDGILTAYEVMNLHLEKTSLVVMSACETGLGEVKNGEGVYGLQRAFMVAGCDNLIMSLWKVNDQTTQLLMSQFYEHWLQGKTKLEAFNQAILSVRSQYAEPYYWGAFVMLGK